MSDEKQGITIPGVQFGFKFYFVCSEGHLHTARVEADNILPEALTEENLLGLQRSICAHMSQEGHELRPATDEDIAKAVRAAAMGEEIAQLQADGKVVLPGNNSVN